MPSSLTTTNLSWSTPDGHAVLTDVSISFSAERVGIVGRNGVGKSTLLRLLAGDLAPSTGSITRSGSIARLRQLTHTAADESIADLMGIRTVLAALHRAEAGLASIEELTDIDWTLEARAEQALAAMGLDAPLDKPLAHLSGGQRTRAALAGAIFAAPDFLLLDEPTNDLDAQGRAAVLDLLRDWRTGAIVVSHDRALFEEMDAIVELTPLGAQRYGGNWSAYRARKAIELAAAEQAAEAAEQRMARVKQTVQQTVERQQRRDAAGTRKAVRGDMPKVLLGMRRDRAERTRGGNARLAERQITDASRDVAHAKARIERVDPLAITIATTGLAASQRVLDVAALHFAYADGVLVLDNVSLEIIGPERIAITGANGTGKSTLLALIAGTLAPKSGHIATRVPFALFDQQVSLIDPSLTIAANFARLNPGMDNNACRAALARFGFRADAANQRVDTLSGGQRLRAGLACVLGGPILPSLLLLDEPTNHLDLESIAAVEAGLNAYDGALLVVSHDAAFLDAIGLTRRIALPSPAA
ncbi:ABC-F family ATP-binding cassette domain-containing protein [Sphingomonas radiodurans]|uniref:ABC-F family ATP-binding cassette domain-containing protein n=1 Tax=Sphingomonas radiodurans TaxID=2890321 RepID=UPI001E503D90|nr:ABC-F family ATP-binding cassette domain-containing protein [Sphingomonas radiodurans]WBH15264.1 ABC-F family ATP-binding cassette domain-containing protein [Sphingomonas radiodurans]